MDMTEANKPAPESKHARLKLPMLLIAYIVACCLSMLGVIHYYGYMQLFAFDSARLVPALLTLVPVAVLSLLFVFSRFSFGYYIGFCFFTMILSYLWLAKFSLLDYDHSLGTLSALASLLALLVPALFVTSPLRQRIVLSQGSFEILLSLILVLSAAVIVVGVFYNFRVVGLAEIYKFRTNLEFPRPLAYAIGIISNAFLPFAFASYFLRGHRWRAGAALLLLLSFYPITLTKLAFFAPFWLFFLALLAERFEARIAVVLSLFLVIVPGLLLQQLEMRHIISTDLFISYFGPINFRMIATPAIVQDMYADFFSKHALTHFCQMSFVKPFVTCPYSEPLQMVMNSNYGMGYANASLFGNEGVASLGLKWAPVSAFVCGLVIALANRLSATLPAKFVLLSAGVLTQVLMNVPIATSMLSNGAFFLFLLWYITPRAAFEKPKARSAASSRKSA
jgi:hypothetical protein